MAADQDETFVVLLEALGIGLTKNLTGRGEVNGVQMFSGFVTDVFPTLVKGICLHHGPMAAAVGIVVYLLLFVQGVVADLMTVDSDDVPFLGPAQNGLAKHVSHHVRKEGHDMDVIGEVHGVTSLRSGGPGGSPPLRWSLR